MFNKFLLLGDVMLGENHYHYRRGIRTLFNNKYSELIDPKVKSELFDNVDSVFLNFEYSLVEDSFSFDNLTSSIYRATLSSLDTFPKGKNYFINIANNHFSQHGKEAAIFTKQKLKEFGHVILGENSSPVEFITKEKKILFWGVSLIFDRNYCGEYFRSTYDDLIETLELPNNKQENEEWWISIHWGDEYMSRASKQQKELAANLSQKGFGLIIGHHPHVIQNIEQIDNTTVIYSLGNFIFDQNFSKDTQKGLVIKIDTKDYSLMERIVTIQKNYRVNKLLKENEKHKKFSIPYNLALIFNSLLMRLLMKIELILNINKVSRQTKQFLLKSKSSR